MTRETVFIDTPASIATSKIVAEVPDEIEPLKDITGEPQRR